MLRCVIVDDEVLAREILHNYLSRLEGIGDVHSFGNARDALTYLNTEIADVLFLDIEMPNLTGIEFLKSLLNPPVTVFTTAYRNYAFEGFELGVIDFLLKPIAFPRFVQAVDKVREFMALKAQQIQVDASPVNASPDTIFVKSGVQRIRLALDSVTYIQGLKDYAIIHTDTGKIVLKGSIKAMEALFPPNRFIRVHKSFIVALSRISRLERNRLLLNTSHIPIGRSFRHDLETALSSIR
jgi:DNA-binding LytR/AlgR family response regulator